MIKNWIMKKNSHQPSLMELIVSADAARDRGEYTEAAAGYKKVLSINPKRADIWVQYGNMLKDSGHFGEAENAYLEAISQNPDIADTYLQYGHLLKRFEHLEEAATAYHKAVMLDPSHQNPARGELRKLAEKGIKTANFPLPSPHAPPRNTPLNAKLLSVRQEIAELIGHLNKQAVHINHNSDRGSAQTDTLKESYYAVSELLHRLNGASLDTPIITDSTIGEAKTSVSVKTTIAFDVSDLYQYFRHNRLPTGIQRVQIEIIPVALILASPELDVRIICFTEAGDFWREIPSAHFVELCDLALEDGDWTALDWRNAMEITDTLLREASEFVFPQGAYLVNLGTSWWLQNYFLRVREAKKEYKIRYVPFVHDMIPILTPEFCVAGLIQDFISWVLGVFIHADYYFVNSEATRRDLKKVATLLGYVIPDDNVVTIRLDADFRKPRAQSVDPDRLAIHRVVPRNYVLFVGTIEPRKNHLLALTGWRRLIKKYDARAIPKLVCVGKRGWLNDMVFAQLGAMEDLKECVVMLSGVPDDVLSVLYENCLFTIFPSAYEGWRLPVTESLCYGKVPVTCNISSLPEAGGEFAEYFHLGDEDGFFAAVERLIFDKMYRETKEQLIRDSYTPRTWKEVSNDIVDSILSRWAAAHFHSDVYLPAAKLGVYYPLRRNLTTKIHRGLVSGEPFRVGDAWWGCDDWGCWLKRMPGRLTIRINEESECCRFYLGLRGLPQSKTPFDVTVLGHQAIRGELAPAQIRWIWFDIGISRSKNIVINVVIEGYRTEIEAPREDAEPRTISVGVIGFMICHKDNLPTRVNFIEAIALENLDALLDQSEDVTEAVITEESMRSSTATSGALA